MSDGPARDRDGDRDLVESYIDALWMERGLAENTLAAYRTDLRGFASWLGERHRDLLTATRADVLEYLAGLAMAPPRSVARRLSSLRRFYQYLMRHARMAEDPCARVEAPRIGRSLPITRAKRKWRHCWRRRIRVPARACVTGPCWNCSTPRACGYRSSSI